MTYIMAIDQGTSSSRAIVFQANGEVVATHQEPLQLQYPHSGWVEFDVEAMWASVRHCLTTVIEKAGLSADDIEAIGITNQRETTVVWDRSTGKAIYPAIVWQDRRTADFCRELENLAGFSSECQQRTGLLLDPYFSASKVRWVLQHVDGAMAAAKQGRLAFGTVDSYLLWRLTGGKEHATDATNASRTLLYNIQQGQWDEALLDAFNVPASMLPEVKDCNGEFGVLDPSIVGRTIPITGMIGDQQAAAIGNGCVEPGSMKSTYGTGCFMLLNTGDHQVVSEHRLLSTVAYQVSSKVSYALEGSIFVAGAATGWLRQGLGLHDQIDDTQAIASSLDNNGGVYFVPALTGLGAPYWQPDARGVIVGLSMEVGVPHLVRAALEAVCYQTRDLLGIMRHSYRCNSDELRVDGGMVKNDWLLQFLADICSVNVVRSSCVESTALGAAVMSALGCGLLDELSDVKTMWRQQQVFTSRMQNNDREELISGWKTALSKAVVL